MGRKAEISEQAQAVESHITDLYWNIIWHFPIGIDSRNSTVDAYALGQWE